MDELYVHASIHTDKCTYIYIYICIYVQYLYMCIHVYIHAHISVQNFGGLGHWPHVGSEAVAGPPQRKLKNPSACLDHV